MVAANLLPSAKCTIMTIVLALHFGQCFVANLPEGLRRSSVHPAMNGSWKQVQRLMPCYNPNFPAYNSMCIGIESVWFSVLNKGIYNISAKEFDDICGVLDKTSECWDRYLSNCRPWNEKRLKSEGRHVKHSQIDDHSQDTQRLAKARQAVGKISNTYGMLCKNDITIKQFKESMSCFQRLTVYMKACVDVFATGSLDLLIETAPELETTNAELNERLPVPFCCQMNAFYSCLLYKAKGTCTGPHDDIQTSAWVATKVVASLNIAKNTTMWETVNSCWLLKQEIHPCRIAHHLLLDKRVMGENFIKIRTISGGSGLKSTPSTVERSYEENGFWEEIASCFRIGNYTRNTNIGGLAGILCNENLQFFLAVYVCCWLICFLVCGRILSRSR